VSTIEELLERKSSGSGLENRDYATSLYPQKLALTSPTNGGRSVGIVRSRTQTTELNDLHFNLLYTRLQNLDILFLVNVFKIKIDSCPIKDDVGLRVPTQQIADSSTFSVSNVSGPSPSTR
jgi:hypothetical protein